MAKGKALVMDVKLAKAHSLSCVIPESDCQTIINRLSPEGKFS